MGMAIFHPHRLLQLLWVFIAKKALEINPEL